MYSHLTISHSLNDAVLFYLLVLLALLLTFNSIHIRTKHLPVLVHPFGVNTIYPSLYIPFCSVLIIILMINRSINLPDRGRWETRDRLCHPIINQSHHMPERITYRKQAKRCKNGILMQNLRCMFIFRWHIWNMRKVLRKEIIDNCR